MIKSVIIRKLRHNKVILCGKYFLKIIVKKMANKKCIALDKIICGIVGTLIVLTIAFAIFIVIITTYTEEPATERLTYIFQLNKK